MTLGSPILSTARMQLRHLALFASWEDEAALDGFLHATDLGRMISEGWHVRLALLRRWGYVAEWDHHPVDGSDEAPSEPVIAITLARMKISQIPRFIRWGKPVEDLVRDHPGTTMALAAMRPPRTVSTLSIWRSQREMHNMVRGQDSIPGSDRHAVAMAERERKDFHVAFTTLRFKAFAEHGEWNGRPNIIP